MTADVSEPLQGLLLWRGQPFTVLRRDGSRAVYESPRVGTLVHDSSRGLWIATIGPASAVADAAAAALTEAATLAVTLLRRQADELERLLMRP